MVRGTLTHLQWYQSFLLPQSSPCLSRWVLIELYLILKLCVIESFISKRITRVTNILLFLFDYERNNPPTTFTQWKLWRRLRVDSLYDSYDSLHDSFDSLTIFTRWKLWRRLRVWRQWWPGDACSRSNLWELDISAEDSWTSCPRTSSDSSGRGLADSPGWWSSTWPSGSQHCRGCKTWSHVSRG